jgi:N-acetylglucosaminyl-diphospho-decaprenol L-rhamnosyltransferase
VLENLSIIIPVFNGRSVLEKALDILERDAQGAEIICVDGGSTDGALELIKSKPFVRLLEVKNFGWSHANNRGFEIATRQVLLTMNSDVFVNRKALEMMVSRLLEQPKLGAVGPVIQNVDGSRQWVFGLLYRFNWVKIQNLTRVNLLHGSCLMTRRDVLEKIGGFDENFFFYNEEFDWCWRLGKHGFQLEILPVSAIHVQGASTGKQHPDFLVEQFRGSLYLIQKHFGGLLLESTRRLFQLLGWVGKNFASRDEMKLAWGKIENLAKLEKYLESPLGLSGRGELAFESEGSEISQLKEL